MRKRGADIWRRSPQQRRRILSFQRESSDLKLRILAYGLGPQMQIVREFGAGLRVRIGFLPIGFRVRLTTTEALRILLRS